jgi:hypothetical protein
MLCLFLLLNSFVAAQTAQVPADKTAPVRIPFFSVAPTVDGKLDDAAWQTAVILKSSIRWVCRPMALSLKVRAKITV